MFRVCFVFLVWPHSEGMTFNDRLPKLTCFPLNFQHLACVKTPSSSSQRPPLSRTRLSMQRTPLFSKTPGLPSMNGAIFFHDPDGPTQTHSFSNAIPNALTSFFPMRSSTSPLRSTAVTSARRFRRWSTNAYRAVPSIRGGRSTM